MDAPYTVLEQLEPGIARVLAPNPSAFTYTGTQTYLVGDAEVAVIDPGPDLPEHLEALTEAIGGRPVAAIMCTHTHRDHSPAARPLAQATGAPVIGCAPLALECVGPRADAAFDSDYAPDRVLEDGEGIELIGEIEDVAVGETKSVTLDLSAGNYVFICNIWDEEEQESHYQEGMRTTFTVS